MIADRVWRVDIDGVHAVAEALRNSAPRLKDRALTGPANVAQIPELADRGLARTERFLEGFDALLGDGPFLAGERFSAADIIAFVTIDFAGWLKLKLPADAVKAQRWYDSIAARPSAAL